MLSLKVSGMLQVLESQIQPYLTTFVIGRLYSSSVNHLKELCHRQVQQYQTAGIYKRDKVIITSVIGSMIEVKGHKGKLLNFGSSDYYGLAFHPKVIAAARSTIDRFGLGLCSPRNAAGTQDVHKQLELKLAQFHNREEAILYPTCYHANIGLFNALLGPEDAVFSDEFNHASIINGLQLSKCRKLVYHHKDMLHLESLLKQAENARLKVIVTDGIFSLLGTAAPLRDICMLADKYNSLIFMDESHATGVTGDKGRGTEEYFGVQGQVDLITSTLGKAIGVGHGGYTTAPRVVIDLLKQASKSFRLTNALPPSTAAAGCVALDILMSEEGADLLKTLYQNIQHYKQEMTRAGFHLNMVEDHPVIPVQIGDSQMTIAFAQELLKKGIFTVSVSEPVARKGESFLRVQVSALHSMKDIEQAVNVFSDVGKAKGVI